MTNKKTTRKALLSSLLSLLLCMAMLIGATFAWFTDSVTSKNNIIKSGNLDVTLDYYNEETKDFDEVTKEIALFDSAALWEPGHTEVAYLKVGNAGSLALKYQLQVNVYDEKTGLTKDGEEIRLSDHLVFSVIDIEETEVGTFTRETAMEKAGDVKGLKEYLGETTPLVKKGDADYVALVIYMPTSVGNEANHNGKDVPQIEMGVNLYATQLTSEEDSFGPDYDEGAWADGMTVYNAEDLKAALQSGATVELGAPITVDEVIDIPEGVTNYLDLNGMDLSAADPQNTYVINNGGTLTLRDSGSTGKSRAVSARGIYNGYSKEGNNVSTAKLTIESGEFNAMGTNGGAAVYNYGILEIKGGTFTSNGGYALNNQATGVMTVSNASVTGGIYNLGDLTVNNSSVYQHISGRHAIYNWAAKLVINSGEFDSASGNELILADGQGSNVVINGGTFNKTAKSWLLGAATGKDITFTINGGEFNGYVNKPENSVDTIRPYGDPIVVNGGTFNFDPTKWLASGMSAAKLEDGRWLVLNANGTTKVPAGVTLDLEGKEVGTIEALGDLTIKGNATIKTLKATNGGTITLEEGKTLTLNNFSFGASANKDAEYVIKGGTVKASYGFFQHGTYKLYSDFETGYMYYSYGSDITVYGTFHSQGKGDGLDYIRGKVTIAKGGKSIHDKSLWVGQPASWGAMNATLIVEEGAYVQANSLNVYEGSSVQIQAKNMVAGEVKEIVCNSLIVTGTLETLENNNLKAVKEGNKIVLK